MKIRKIINKLSPWLESVFLLLSLGVLFYYLGITMGVSNMINTIFATSHQLLLNTILYLMGITVISGALSSLLSEFGAITLLEIILWPLMSPIFRLPGRTALAAIMTFFSDNPAIITFAKDKNFRSGFAPWQLASLTNFGTAFGMGLLVVTFMGTLELPNNESAFTPALIGLFGAIFGSIVSTRLMQYMSRPLLGNKLIGEDKEPNIHEVVPVALHKKDPRWLRGLNSMLAGGKSGVELGLAVIPGVIIISSLVMILTFGPGVDGYTGEAFQGVSLLPFFASKFDWLFGLLFGFKFPELIAFPVTSMGAVGAALSLMPEFINNGWITGNEIAVFTAVGMCFSGYLSTHTAMLDALGYRKLISKGIFAHTIGGISAGMFAHYIYVLFF